MSNNVKVFFFLRLCQINRVQVIRNGGSKNHKAFSSLSLLFSDPTKQSINYKLHINAWEKLNYNLWKQHKFKVKIKTKLIYASLLLQSINAKTIDVPFFAHKCKCSSMQQTKTQITSSSLSMSHSCQILQKRIILKYPEHPLTFWR